MIWAVARTIAIMSEFTTLDPGDQIAIGTPPGVGHAKKPNPRWLRPGETIEIDIERHRHLRQPGHGRSRRRRQDRGTMSGGQDNHPRLRKRRPGRFGLRARDLDDDLDRPDPARCPVALCLDRKAGAAMRCCTNSTTSPSPGPTSMNTCPARFVFVRNR